MKYAKAYYQCLSQSASADFVYQTPNSIRRRSFIYSSRQFHCGHGCFHHNHSPRAPLYHCLMQQLDKRIFQQRRGEFQPV